jgi:hypothetical protein
MGVKAARGQLVQQGLPDVGASSIDQGDVSQFLFTQTFAQLGSQRQSSGPSTDDDDTLHKTPTGCWLVVFAMLTGAWIFGAGFSALLSFGSISARHAKRYF